MKEQRRILSNHRMGAGLALILLINIILFVRTQSVQNYGLGGSLTASTIFVFGGEGAAEAMDAKEAYAHYLQWLEEVKTWPLEEAASMLEQEKARLSDIQTISRLLKSTDTAIRTGASLDTYREEWPELVRQLENGEIDGAAVEFDWIAINHLLAQSDYLSSYGDWLETIQKNKDNMLAFPIFNDPDRFSGRNILKTAGEFEKLSGVNLSLGADGAVNALLSFGLADYLLLAVLCLFCFSFLEERKAGLWSVVHAAPNGRLRLAVHRTMILFRASVCSVLLLYGTNLAAGFFLYGGIHDLGRAVQSVEALGRLPVPCTVGGFLIHYFLLRIASAFLVSLLLWLLLTAANNVRYAIVAAAGVLAVEYGLYTFLPVQSAFNGLKYFNLFTYISLPSLYTNYLNINLFGYPLGIRIISQIFLLPLCLLLTAACIFLHCHKKPAAGKDILGRIACKINRAADRWLCHLRLFGFELYKTLWIQRGIVVFALFVYAAAKLSFTASIPANLPAENAARQYAAEFEGEITDDTFAKMDALAADLDRIIAEYEDAKTAYENGEITPAQFNVSSYNAETARVSREGLAIVQSRAEELKAYSGEKGFSAWLMDETPFESVYGSAAQSNQHKAAAAAVFALTLLLAGSMVYERQSGMAFVLGASPRGRGALFRSKILLAGLAAAAVWAVIYGMELYALISDFPIRTWDVPVQNLSMMMRFPIRCSIRGWLVILYGYRLWMLFAGALVLLAVSGWSRCVEAACIAGGGILLIPSLLYTYAGIDVFRPLACLNSIAAMPLLNCAEGAVSLCLQWAAAFTAAAGISVVRLTVIINKWKNRKI